MPSGAECLCNLEFILYHAHRKKQETARTNVRPLSSNDIYIKTEDAPMPITRHSVWVFFNRCDEMPQPVFVGLEDAFPGGERATQIFGLFIERINNTLAAHDARAFDNERGHDVIRTILMDAFGCIRSGAGNIRKYEHVMHMHTQMLSGRMKFAHHICKAPYQLLYIIVLCDALGRFGEDTN